MSVKTSMERWWQILTGVTEAFGERPVLLTLFPPQISHGVTWNGTGVPRQAAGH